jgi:FlaA1/EpsC-like NDP-sugar epimerase
VVSAAAGRATGERELSAAGAKQVTSSPLRNARSGTGILVQIADKVFVVTGGANGMGREVVLGLLSRGARIAVVDIDEGALADVNQMLDNCMNES